MLATIASVFHGPAPSCSALRNGVHQEATALIIRCTSAGHGSRSTCPWPHTLLFEALRQRQAAGLAPQNGKDPAGDYDTLLFEWWHPEVAAWCRDQGRPYPLLGDEGEILEELPRTAKLRC